MSKLLKLSTEIDIGSEFQTYNVVNRLIYSRFTKDVLINLTYYNTN